MSFLPCPETDRSIRVSSRWPTIRSLITTILKHRRAGGCFLNGNAWGCGVPEPDLLTQRTGQSVPETRSRMLQSGKRGYDPRIVQKTCLSRVLDNFTPSVLHRPPDPSSAGSLIGFFAQRTDNPGLPTGQLICLEHPPRSWRESGDDHKNHPRFLPLRSSSEFLSGVIGCTI